MMDLKDKRIGYWPYHKSCAVAGDRRRFIFFAKEKGIPFEIADPQKKYDIVYLTNGCNITEWLNYKKKNPGTRIIFELIDSLLLEGPGMYTFFRGIVRYLSGREGKFYPFYKTALRKMITASDAVVCATSLQKKDMIPYNKNVHISLDYFSDDITHHKETYETSGKLKIAWEGQAYTAFNIMLLNDVFEKLKDEVELHIITDREIRYPFKIFNRKTARILKNLKCRYQIHDWEKQTFSGIISRCDLSIIPLTNKQNLMWNKPENKLLLLWEIGIPVLSACTPAYKRVMDAAGLDFHCDRQEDWLKKIKRYINSTVEERKNKAALASAYLKNNHSKEIILKKWDAIFDSV